MTAGRVEQQARRHPPTLLAGPGPGPSRPEESAGCGPARRAHGSSREDSTRPAGREAVATGTSSHAAAQGRASVRHSVSSPRHSRHGRARGAGRPPPAASESAEGRMQGRCLRGQAGRFALGEMGARGAARVSPSCSLPMSGSGPGRARAMVLKRRRWRTAAASPPPQIMPPATK